MQKNRTLSLLLLVALTTLGFTHPPQAADGFDVSNAVVTYNFGKQISFNAQLTSASQIAQATISFRDVSEQNTRVDLLTLNPDGSTVFQYDASQNVIAPFATITFSYQVTFADGKTASSQAFYFRYADNRFTWKTLTDGSLNVNWYNGNDAFGHAALDAARASLQNIEPVVPVSLDQPVDVYVYANTTDLQSALTIGGKQWVAGHADPTVSAVMVSVSPGPAQTLELQRQVPHELTHVMLYRSVGGAGYNRLPTWLNEGLASTAELYPNPDYLRALTQASKNNTLIDFTDLCASFPADSGSAFQAYAQSESFVRYLRTTYGDTDMTILIKSYADGLDCNIGAMRALGTPLDQLDTHWREAALGQNTAAIAARNLLPYIILLALILIVPIWSAATALTDGKENVSK